MTTNNTISNRPTTGRLWHGGRVIMENEPFRHLQYRRMQLIREGYDKKLFRITY